MRSAASSSTRLRARQSEHASGQLKYCTTLCSQVLSGCGGAAGQAMHEKSVWLQLCTVTIAPHILLDSAFRVARYDGARGRGVGGLKTRMRSKKSSWKMVLSGKDRKGKAQLSMQKE
ncbi:hypothetical protein ANO11243_041090 [Dothideomycetidae sp. 11243]|nr:hypothetical protein ANO11243_041090 [fungal sp. No.11243]